jgi:hypothetical protein
MPSLVIRLDPAKLARATADVRYEIPARLAARSHGLIQEDGYDYEPGDAMQIYLRTSDLARALPMVVALLENERFDGELLTPAAEVGVSDVEAIDTKAFRVVFPAAATGFIVPWRPPTLAERALVEELYGFRFPPAFHALVDRPPEALRRLFPRGRFTTSTSRRPGPVSRCSPSTPPSPRGRTWRPGWPGSRSAPRETRAPAV